MRVIGISGRPQTRMARLYAVERGWDGGRFVVRGLRGPSMAPAPAQAQGPAIRLSGFAPGESVEPPFGASRPPLSAGQTRKGRPKADFLRLSGGERGIGSTRT